MRIQIAVALIAFLLLRLAQAAVAIVQSQLAIPRQPSPLNQPNSSSAC